MPWYQLLVYVIWMGSEVMLGRLRRSGQGDSSTTDKSTLRLIWLTLMPSVALAVFLSIRTNCRLYEADIFRIIGLLLMLAGIVFRLLVVRSLGAAFTVDVAIVPGHALRQTGFFRLVRHPSYAFSLLTFFAFGIVLNNGWSMLMLMVPVFLAFNKRMNVEEVALTAHFGEEYRAYMSRTKRLIPFIY